jgi:hypothetical protein
MASLRGGTTLWSAVTGATVAQNAVSAPAYVGAAPFVVVYIKGAGSAVASTFKLQVADDPSRTAGLNLLDSEVGAPGWGVDWYDYTGGPTLAVGIGANVAFELSPFGPQILRLVRTDANGTDNFEAFVTSYGPN